MLMDIVMNLKVVITILLTSNFNHPIEIYKATNKCSMHQRAGIDGFE